jgi:cell division protein ZapE
MHEPAPTGRATPDAGVRGLYEARVAAGEIAPDAAQREVVRCLDELASRLAEAPSAAPRKPLGWLFGGRREDAPPTRGLYVYGDVGRGKTMLMDMFFEVAPVARKRRVHFHVFMQDVHARIHATRQAIAEKRLKGDDPVPPVAAALAAQAKLLCFDEFAVTDIADAMILGRLFTQMFALGVVLVATSNVAPDDLYRDGINRGHFLGFIDLLKARVEVVRLDAREDYRLDKLAGEPVYFTPLGPAAEAAQGRLFRGLTGVPSGAPATLSVDGRAVDIPEVAGGIARASFDDLCRRPLGSHDYLALAQRCHTLFLIGVPILDAANRNEAKRLITLIDTLYDQRVRLVVTAAAEPVGLYLADAGTEAFEFQRTASRLYEMRSASYLASVEAPPLT